MKGAARHVGLPQSATTFGTLTHLPLHPLRATQGARHAFYKRSLIQCLEVILHISGQHPAVGRDTTPSALLPSFHLTCYAARVFGSTRCMCMYLWVYMHMLRGSRFREHAPHVHVHVGVHAHAMRLALSGAYAARRNASAFRDTPCCLTARALLKRCE